MDSVDSECSSVSFRVLGPITVLVDGAVQEFGGARQRRLFALLLLHTGHVVDVDTLAEHLWDDDERPNDFGRAIRTYVSRIRRSLRDAGLEATAMLTTAAPGYRIVLDDVTLDSARFEELVRRARQEFDDGDALRASSCLDEALLLWRGLPYAEFADRPWAEAESTRLVELLRAATELQCASRIELGEHAEVVGELERMVSDDPLRARSVELLMLALFKADRQAEALRTAQRHRRALQDVGLDVSDALAELDSRIAASDESLRQVGRRHLRVQDTGDQVAPLRSVDRVRNNLPVTEGALLGREGVVSHIRELIEESSLVTVVGVGGIGKTRVGLAVAAELLERFVDGVWFCDLAAVSDADSVFQVVADAIGARQRPERSMLASVAEFCREREMLVVLDNCEHVLDRCADVVEAVVAISASVTFLATSREALGLPAEVTYPIDPLVAEGHDNSAVKLFDERATRVDPTRIWSHAETAAVERICGRLDGIPLAIELAAARTRSLTPIEIEDRLGDAFKMFRGARRSIERHRTMEAAIGSSYDALGDPERSLFVRLSVFSGSCDLAAIEAVCSGEGPVSSVDIEVVLNRLVDKNMVTSERTALDTTRYRLLEPLRQFASDRLGHGDGVDALRSGHLDYYTRWAEAWNEDIWGPGRDLLERLEAEFANLRSAIDWAIETTDVDRALRTIDATGSAGRVFDRHEPGDWAIRALGLDGAGDHLLGPAVAALASLTSWFQGDVNGQGAYLDQAESMSSYDPHAYQPTAVRAGQVGLILGDLQGARRLLDRVRPINVRERTAVALEQVMMLSDPGHKEAGVKAVHQLRLDADNTGSAVVEVIASESESWLLLDSFEFDAALNKARDAVNGALDIRAERLAHFDLFILGLAAGAARSAIPRDLELMRNGLREQRNAGNEMDQWLILIGAAVALWDPDLARRVQHGLKSGKNAHSVITGTLPAFFPKIVDSPVAPSDEVSLDVLVDQATATITRFLDESSTT